jgi:hypothetical protein
MKPSRPFFRTYFAALAAIFLLAQPFAAFALVLSPRSIVMERELPGVASNQEIRFFTPSGVISAGQTMALHYPTGFDLSPIGVGDIDLFYGPSTGLENSTVLAAAAGVNIWGVNIDAPNRTITFTAPTNVGPIPAASFVVIRIGTIASGGVNKIANPSGLGDSAVFIAIDGTFGDTGGIDLPLFNNSQIAVTAHVNATSSSPGGGGGGPGTGLTPPVISNVQVINITGTTATVTWDTDESATGLVDYGLTTAYGSTASHSGLLINHSVNLASLSPSTLYHFRITSADSAGDTTVSSDFNFTTTPLRAPVISNVRVTSITDTSAIVLWDTDIPSDSTLDYGLTAAYGSTLSNAALVTSHSIPLSGLSATTLYHLRVSSSSNGLSATSSDLTFTTLADLTPPANVFGFTASPGNHQNTLSWTNPTDPDFAFVRIRARTDGYPSGPNDGRFVYQGAGQNFVDPGLVNGTTYYYANYAYDASGNPSSGAFASATPFGPPVIPTPTSTRPIPTPTPTSTRPVTPTPTSTLPVPTSTPPIVVPTSTIPVPPGITIAPQYYGANGTIELQPTAAGQINTLAGRSILVRVPTAGLGRSPQSAVIRIGDSMYALAPIGNGDVWAASFTPSNKAESLPALVTFRFADGSQATAEATIVTQGAGHVLARFGVSPVPVGLEGATVTLYQLTVSGWQKWDGGRFGQANPVITDANGSYAFLVENGTYRVVADKDSFQENEVEVTVRDNVVSSDIILSQIVQIPVVGPLLGFIQSSSVQQAAVIATPVAVAFAVSNLLLATSAANLLNYLWFLFTQPFLIFGRRKRQRWGIVYNSLSKVPVDLVAVRLVHANTNLILQTRVTDSKGRFTFRVRPGQYRLEAKKQGYIFPSEYLKGETTDGDYLDVYHGELIDVKEDTTLSPNLPMDPLVKEETPRSIRFKNFLRQLQGFVGFLSILVALGVLFVSPSWLTFGLFIAQIFTYLLFRRLARPKPPKGWGIVYDSKSRRPLGQVVVRIFDKKFNKLIETQLTDNRGNYGFFAKNNVYVVKADKTGFNPYLSQDIDLTKTQAGAIDQHIQMKSAQAKDQPPESNQ